MALLHALRRDRAGTHRSIADDRRRFSPLCASYVAAGGCLILLGDPEARKRWEAPNRDSRNEGIG
jgi:hypothetical protein